MFLFLFSFSFWEKEGEGFSLCILYFKVRTKRGVCTPEQYVGSTSFYATYLRYCLDKPFLNNLTFKLKAISFSNSTNLSIHIIDMITSLDIDAYCPTITFYTTGFYQGCYFYYGNLHTIISKVMSDVVLYNIMCVLPFGLPEAALLIVEVWPSYFNMTFID